MFSYPKSLFARLVAVSLVFSLALVVLSSLMRLSNQGLGCGDWPECYDSIDVVKYARDIDSPESTITRTSAIVPDTFVERAHRLVASSLQLFIIAISIIAWLKRKNPGQPVALPIVLLGLSLFLAFLGVWYGSPLLRPPVVMANLLGGITMVGMFWWLWLSLIRAPVHHTHSVVAYRKWAIAGLLVVIIQTSLGGWMSSNFAALACTTFPDCNGSWWPDMNVSKGFTVRSKLDVDTDGKVIVDQAAAISIQMAHRVGAIFVLLFIGCLGYKVTKLGGRFRAVGRAILIILLLQVVIGITVVLFGSPLYVVVAHNFEATLLWLSIITLIYYLSYRTQSAFNSD
ncbi:MAG: heme A synthase [Gammaproteobacteria bacterium]|nr:heme A synthase [Gammaproteobacteria bacterium]